MVRTKNVIKFSLNNSKSWVNSWHLNKNDYNSIVQEDLLFFLYFRSILLLFDRFLEIIKLRIYRNKKTIFIDIFLTFGKIIDKEFFTKFSNDCNLNFGYNKQIFLFVNKVNFMLYSNYVAVKIAKFLEKRIKFKSKLTRFFLDKIICFCLGIKVQCSGRLNQVDMARISSISFGLIPLQSTNLNIDFSFVAANTNVGLQSVKVWIYI